MSVHGCPVLVTGASGFIGSAIWHTLRQHNGSEHVIGTCRTPPHDSSWVIAPGLDANSDWSSVVEGVRTIIHCAALVPTASDMPPLALKNHLYKANVEGTLALAQQAAAHGVKRFIFLSSVKVHGESTLPGHPFTHLDIAKPEDDYGRSKAEAELLLARLAMTTGMEIVIIRPPLVYGPGVGGNFKTLIKALERGMPLPLGAITTNRRSMVALHNLVDLVMTCIDHPAAANETFMVSDGEDLSTAELLTRLGKTLNKPPRLLSVPSRYLWMAARIFGKHAIARRLLGDLQVDISHTCNTLDWQPLITVEEGLRQISGLNQR